jgi:hypothetical protein
MSLERGDRSDERSEDARADKLRVLAWLGLIKASLFHYEKV